MTVKVQNINIDDIEFKQDGFSLFYSSDHDIKAEWRHEKKNITSVFNKFN